MGAQKGPAPVQARLGNTHTRKKKKKKAVQEGRVERDQKKQRKRKGGEWVASEKMRWYVPCKCLGAAAAAAVLPSFLPWLCTAASAASSSSSRCSGCSTWTPLRTARTMLCHQRGRHLLHPHSLAALVAGIARHRVCTALLLLHEVEWAGMEWGSSEWYPLLLL